MANKREFKKYVDALGASVIDELVSSYYNVEGVDRDKITQAIEKVLGAVGRSKSNSNIKFDRGPKAFDNIEEYSKAKKAFFVALFDKIDTEFDESINQAVKLLNEAIPASVKAQNKEIANA